MRIAWEQRQVHFNVKSVAPDTLQIVVRSTPIAGLRLRPDGPHHDLREHAGGGFGRSGAAEERDGGGGWRSESPSEFLRSAFVLVSESDRGKP